MRFYCDLKERGTAHDMVRHEMSLRKLQRRSHSTDVTRENQKPDIRRRNTRRKGGKVNNVGASGSLSIPSSLRAAC